MVHDGHENVVVRADGEQSDHQRHPLCDIETGGRQLGQPGVEILHDLRFGQGAQVHCGGRLDLLDRTVRAVGVDGPQGLVAFEDVEERVVQCVPVEGAPQAEGQWDVEDRGARVELVDGPHAALGRRQRHRPVGRTASGAEFGDSTGRRIRQPGGEVGDRR